LSPASSSPWTAGSWPIRGFSGEASSTFFCGCKKRRLKAEGTAWPFAKDTRPGEGTRRNGRPGSGMGQQGDLTVIGRCRSAADAGEHRSGLLLVRHTRSCFRPPAGEGRFAFRGEGAPPPSSRPDAAAGPGAGQRGGIRLLRGAGSAICFPRPFSLSIRHRLESFLLPRVPHRRQGDGGFSRGFDWHHDFLIRRTRWVSEDLHFSPSAEKEWILKERFLSAGETK